MVKYEFLLRAFLGLIALSTIFRLCDSGVVVKEPVGGTWNIVSEYDGYEGVPKHAKSVLDMRELGAKGRFVVLQFEIRLRKELECVSAHLENLIPPQGNWKREEFDNSSYSIMFGLKKCGSTSKVHFVLKHKNPTSGEYIEHHLKSPPTVPSDKLSHVYTAIWKPNSDLVILIDGKQKKHANCMNQDDFQPPCILPAKTISDSDDKKPEDGDEQAKIPDLEAVKREDCEMPESKSPIRESVLGWCKREHLRKVRNSAHKGKLHSPPVDNLNCNDTRKAKEIPNPDYCELNKPHFEPIVGIGSKSYTTQDGIKKKILDLLSKLVGLLKKCKSEVKLTGFPAAASASICCYELCFFTLTYERNRTT